MNYESLLTEKFAVVSAIQPQAVTAGATGVLTGAIDCANYTQLLGVLLSGTLGASGTLDFKVVASATSGGTYELLTGKAITQLVKASNDNDIAAIEVDAHEVLTAGKRYIKFNIVAGTANATSAAVVFGAPRNYLASDVKSADLIQVVA